MRTYTERNFGQLLRSYIVVAQRTTVAATPLLRVQRSENVVQSQSRVALSTGRLSRLYNIRDYCCRLQRGQIWRLIVKLRTPKVAMATFDDFNNLFWRLYALNTWQPCSNRPSVHDLWSVLSFLHIFNQFISNHRLYRCYEYVLINIIWKSIYP